MRINESLSNSDGKIINGINLVSYDKIEKIINDVIDIHDKDERFKMRDNMFNELPKSKGICIVIDIVDSTKLKDNSHYNEWIINYFNFFGHWLLHCNNLGYIVIDEYIFYKSIGDGLMIFIPSEDPILDKQLNLINGIESLLMSANLYAKLRVSVHYCEEAFYLGFPSDDRPDYYGLDIDIAFRLNSKAQSQQLVISKETIRKLGISDSYVNIRKIRDSEQSEENLKGCSSTVPFSIYELMKDNLQTVQLSSESDT